MPDSDPTSPSDPPGPASETRNLPVPVPRPSEVAREGGEGWLARALRAIFGWKSGSIRSDLKDVLDAGAGETGFSPEESAMLKNILGLRERRVEDVMVPRADIVAVQQDIVLGELMKVFANAGHSRLVVYDDTLDDAIGMVHIRDLIAFMTERAAASAKANTRRKKPFPAGLDLKAVDLSMPLSTAKIMREILFVPPSMPALDLLAKMQATRIHLALVVDEYGGTDGVVSMEDIVEQIVGEIADEHDEDAAPGVVRQPDGSFLADARASLEDVTAIVGPEFDVAEVAKEVDTLAGYIATRIGRVPVRGELVPGPGPFEIEVLDADPRRVKKLKIYLGTDRERRQPRKPQRRASTAPGASQPAAASPQSTATPPALPRRRALQGYATDRDQDAPRPFDHAGLGMAAHPDRFPRRRIDGAGAAAARHLAGAVHNLSDPGLADRRLGRRPVRRRWRRRRPAGGSVSAISSPASIGSAMRSWSMPRPSAGCCRSRSSRCRPCYTGFGLALARMLWTRGPCACWRSRSR